MESLDFMSLDILPPVPVKISDNFPPVPVKISDIFFYFYQNIFKMYRRKLFDKLVNHLSSKEFTIVTGARQTGKSTLMRQLQEHCKKENIPDVFLNLENKAILGELNENPFHIFRFLPTTEKRIVIFIDEIQYLDNPSNFLKLLFDEHAQQIKIIATGSSAFYLDSRFKDSVAGRKRIFNLLPCTFDEYLEITGRQDLLEEKQRLIAQPDAKSLQIDFLQIEWENFMIYGGYPAVITETNKKDKIARLQEIRDSFVKRDIQESGVSNEISFYQLFRLLAGQTGNLLNINELSNTLRIKHETASNYLSVLEKCFQITLQRPFYRNLRKELVKMPKVVFFDNGMRNCLINNFQPINMRTDKGELWENTISGILLEKYGVDSVQFWRTSAGNEVDFVLAEIENPKAIEAKFDEAQVNHNKYNIFRENYPEIPLHFAWMSPFNEDFFRRIEEL